MDLTETVGECELETVTGFCVSGNEPSASIKDEFSN
jgi:hypothetical protein